MSPKLRRLGGPEVVAALQSLGFDVEQQRGSHIKLRRLDPATSAKQTLTVANHRILSIGTLRAIAKQASRYLTEEELNLVFFID